ncbi:MAG: hypothetical protein WDN49_14955 [Acetobacteraceae bacterium]
MPTLPNAFAARLGPSKRFAAVRAAALALALAGGLGVAAKAEPAPAIHHESFFVGGAYAGPATAQVMQGQMYVEALTPEHVTHPYPLVLIHGLAQTAMNWMTTPDGREGWAEWFAAHGWKVYMIDQPARGRSAWQPGLNGAVKSVPVALIEKLFTAPEDGATWPQAKLHTQWPGGPHKGPCRRPGVRPVLRQPSPVPRQCRERDADAEGDQRPAGPGRAVHSGRPLAGRPVRLADRRRASSPGEGRRGAGARRPALQGRPVPDRLGPPMGPDRHPADL